MVKLVIIVMKENLSSNGETDHNCYENKVYTVMVKLVMIVMKTKFIQ